ncbi:MAG: hypothetical protein V4543_00775 [Bacteroidota bacterium]
MSTKNKRTAPAPVTKTAEFDNLSPAKQAEFLDENFPSPHIAAEREFIPPASSQKEFAALAGKKGAEVLKFNNHQAFYHFLRDNPESEGESAWIEDPELGGNNTLVAWLPIEPEAK